MSYAEAIQRRQKTQERRRKRKAKAKVLWRRDTNKQIMERLDDKVFELVRDRDSVITGGRCLVCLTRPGTIPYHLLSRRHKEIRWDIENVVLGCITCNAREQRNREKYKTLHENIFGVHRMDSLRDKIKVPMQFGRAELLDLEVRLNDSQS